MLATWIGTHVARLPDAPALIVADKPVRYAELAARIDADAGSLLTQGFAPGSTLAVLSRSSLVLARLAWSVSRLGGTLLPLNPAWPEARIDAMLEHAVMHPIRHTLQLEQLIAKR